ncbi:MAG TPA: hypothetical protein ENI60_09850 [Candidatus Fraserbacteria bacterium]|nr:hypothetical protein [Candidatus Fraserbacteria bacterium]
MSLRRLEKQGLLLPRDQWGKHRLTTDVNQPLLALVGVLIIAACALMYAGDGGRWTLIGIVIFFIGLVGLLLLSWRAIDRTVRRFRRAAPGSAEKHSG